MHLVSVPKIFIEASSKIITSHLNNKIGGIVKFAGSPPIEGKLGTVPAELFSHLDRLYQRAYSIIGISQLSAQAQKPQGLNSGKALRTYNDIETERFTSVGRMYEDCALEASKMFIDSIKEIAAETGNFSVKSPGSQFLSKINWSEVEMSEDDYIMQCFPVSALSNDPASRMQEVQELVQSGFMDKTSAMKLLDYPDLRAYYDMANASVNEIERQIELIIDKQEYSSPEPYQNLTYGIVAFQNAYLMYKSQGAPEEVLDLFRRWIEAANDLIKLATAPAVDPLAAQPTAVPQAPPQSELLPNVPAA
jgi:ribosome-binding factor A